MDRNTAPTPVLPVVGWLGGWPISIVSLVLGVAVLFVFRRGLPHVGWIVGYLLLLWLLFVLITQLRAPLLERGRHLVLTVADYTIQTLYHNLLLFVLPAYYAAATLTSVNVLFVALLVGLALLATFDPWYSSLVHPRPWIGALFFVVSIFAALNVALPLLGVRPYVALLLSAWAAVVAVTPAVRRLFDTSWRDALVGSSMGGVVAALLAGVVCVAIPPAPL
ncbi:MAG: DUF5924 family protein, partial [Candidatus Rokuibacteriota bacterium]